jgi:hypothetical protein
VVERLPRPVERADQLDQPVRHVGQGGEVVAHPLRPQPGPVAGGDDRPGRRAGQRHRLNPRVDDRLQLPQQAEPVHPAALNGDHGVPVELGIDRRHVQPPATAGTRVRTGILFTQSCAMQ